ncbi:MAG: SDR family NAD(P)-dependent oxidoreductase [Silicimonas sp.]|nr:SDR family NAD(P)-dependent oxidoreductase [Silicimonas sp.]
MKDIAVLGYAARLPGAETIEDVWQILLDGSSTIGRIPDTRWSEARFRGGATPEPGYSYSHAAGVLDDPFAFDADYFRISRLEAEQMDPQQRILLETCARAFDHAGIDPHGLSGERTGVFVGGAAADHSTSITQSSDLIGPYFMLGNTLSILSNRLSYAWDFQGPSLTVDTACSSSLVALDLARAALERGEIDTAVVAGVNMLLSPYSFIGFSQAGMISPRGICSPFSAEADGYVRSEGAVVFILQNRKKAELANLNLRSLLIGTAVNSDGRTNGLPLPSRQRQSELMKSVIDDFDVDPNALAFVEAHGTGTPVGDPNESWAIGEAYGRGREEQLPIVSSKANFGHLEPAAGLVGLLRAQLCLERGYLPTMPEVGAPNPEIDFEDLNLVLPQKGTALPARDGGWQAAVNSFGFGGTNAHAVIGQAPVKKASVAPFPPALLLTASSAKALSGLAETWATAIETRDPATLASMAVSANRRIARHGNRICLKAGTPALLREAIDQWCEAGGKSQKAAGQDLPVAFIFPGNGTAWAGMARDVFAADSRFRGSFKDCAAAFADFGLSDPEALLFDPDLDKVLNRADVAQPLIFSIQVALARALGAAGVHPAATLGHSVGEYAAAVVAGRLSIVEAVRLIVIRSKAFEPLLDTGTMAALNCSAEEAQALIDKFDLPLDVSAENSPRNVTVSGPLTAIDTLLRAAKAKRISALKLGIPYPYHSRAVDRINSALSEELGEVEHCSSQVHFYSGWAGALADDVALDSQYWIRNARDMVAFKAGIEAMDRDGIGLFLEISPRSVLQGNLRDILAGSDRTHALLDTMKKGAGTASQPEAIARRVLAAGGKVEDQQILGPQSRHTAAVPDYPFDREVLRLAPRAGFAAEIDGGAEHPLLGRRLSEDRYDWQSSLSLARLPWLADHRIAGAVLLPAAAMLDMFHAAARQIAGTEGFELRDVEFLKPVVLDDGTARVRMIFEDETRQLVLLVQKDRRLERAARATLRTAVPALEKECRIAAPRPAGALYEELSRAGLDYGPAFARLDAFGPRTSGIDVALKPGAPGQGMEDFICALDAIFHGAAIFSDARTARVPYRIDRVRFNAGGPVVSGRLTSKEARLQGNLDVSAVDPDGKVVAHLDGLAFHRLPPVVAGGALFHDETRLSLTVVAPRLEERFSALFAGANADPSDLDVTRGALAGRLAWGLCFDRPDPKDPRHGIAAAWLEKLDMAVDEGQGLVARGNCPWPPLDSLIQLTADHLCHASDELAATLLAASAGAVDKRRPLSRVRDWGARLIDRLDGPPLRVLIAGDVDGPLIAKLHNQGHHVTVTAADLDLALADLGDAEGLDFAAQSPDELADRTPFDLVIGLSLLTLDDRFLKPLAEVARAAAETVLIDERADLFALMTHRYVSQAKVATGLRRFGKLHAFNLPQDEAVMVHLGARAAEPETPKISAARILGDGHFAEALAEDMPDAAQATRMVVLPETGSAFEQLDRMRALADALAPEETGWVLSLDHERVAELTGLRRVLCNETGKDLRCAVVSPETEPKRVIEILTKTEERELLLTRGACETLRLQPRPVLPQVPVQARKRLVPTEVGAGTPRPIPVIEPRVAPCDDEVEIEIRAVGLNFRDVMLARGLLPDDAFLGGYAGRNLGIECAGVVSRAGPNARFIEGDRVASFAAGAFASHCCVPEACVLPLPDDVTLAEGATLPVAFLTADYALHDCARLEEGESVLIHGGAGGVGLAAIKLAKTMGLRIFATAGSPEKRRFLQALGVEACFDSRALTFAEDVMQATSGKGVDAVINSLAGSFQAASLECLAPFGRFVELGKRDIFENSHLGLRALRHNISFFAVDADQLVKEREDKALKIMARISSALARGDLRPLPHRRLGDGSLAAGMEMMQRADHIGKIVVEAPTAPAPEAGDDVDYRGAWLITGGTRGFGLATAQWLARRGAQSLWLASRSGQCDPAALEEFAALGLRVESVAVDVTSEADMAALVARIAETDKALAGVVHGAMVLDDAPAADLNEERFDAVWAPKVTGAQVLDRLTRALKPRHFWLYASIAARFGNPGQAAYAAANGALEDLARRRRDEGLPGLAIAWSAIGDTGYLEASAELRGRIADNGVTPLRAADALDALDTALRADPGRETVTIGRVNWNKLAQTLAIRGEPFFEGLRLRAPAVSGTDLDGLILSQGVESAVKTVADLLVKDFARVLRLPEARIDGAVTLGELGFDSLLGMQLRLMIEERLDTQFPANLLSEALTIQRLAEILIEHRVTTSAIDSSMAGSLAAIHLVDTGVSEVEREDIVRAAVDRGRS